jgi:hypothetical protein
MEETAQALNIGGDPRAGYDKETAQTKMTGLGQSSNRILEAMQ